MTRTIDTVVVAGRDAPLWLAASVLKAALAPAGVTVVAVALPTALQSTEVHVAQPALEALHNRLRIEEAALLRDTGGSFALGQHFVGPGGEAQSFLHAYGAYGAPIEGKDFLAFWLKARRHGFAADLERFSLTASAARRNRMLIPNDETEAFGRSDYGYHLPAAAYSAFLKRHALGQGVQAHFAEQLSAVLHPERDEIEALLLDDRRRIEGQLFVDATGSRGDLITAFGDRVRTSWRSHFPADRMLVALGPRLDSLAPLAEIRAGKGGWAGVFPTQRVAYVRHVYSSVDCNDDQAASDALEASGLTLGDAVVARIDQGRRTRVWQGNCVAVGEAACVFDPIHGVGLHAIQLGLVHLLSLFPRTTAFASARDEYNRLLGSSFERIRDFQSAHYVLNRYGESPFWARARSALASDELQHSIATFQARGEIAPWEDESFLPDSWRALLIGHGLMPQSWLPTIDRIPVDEICERFAQMLSFVDAQMPKHPRHDEYLARLAGQDSASPPASSHFQQEGLS